MDRITELKNDRQDLRDQVKEILAAAAKDKRNLTEDEEKKVDTIQAGLDRIEATIKHEEQVLEWDRTEAPAVDRPIGEPSSAQKVPQVGSRKNPWGDMSSPQAKQAAFGEFLQAVARSAKGEYQDPRLAVQASASGLNTGAGVDGGFLVRTDFSTQLLNRGMEEAVLASRCTSIDIGPGADGIELPYIDETSRATGSRWGGVQIYRRTEADTVSASKPRLGMLEIRLEDLMGICYATDRALRDATSLGQIVTLAFGSEFAFRVDDEILRGTGAGQCLGILSSGALISQAAEGSQVADTVVAENIIKMRARLRARNRPNSAWYINQEIETQLPLMVVKVKNVAGAENVGGAPIYMPANGLAGQMFDTLFGKPVIPIEQASAIGDVGDIMLLDLGEYLLIRKGALETAESIHVRFLYGENTFRFTYRINGAPAWKTPLTPYKGANTLGPFITLAAR
jgi:HK97 family phage major capsid protein